MTEQEVREAIVSRYLNQFSAQFPIAIDNVSFSPPETPSKWARINVQFNNGSQDTLGRPGNRKFLSSGVVFIQVFTPINTSTNGNDTTARESKILLDGIRIDDLWLYNGRVVTVGNSDSKYWQQNVVIEFDFEDTR